MEDPVILSVASDPNTGSPGSITPGYPYPQPVLPAPPQSPLFTISAPLSPRPQQYSNIATLINEQAEVVNVVLLYRASGATAFSPLMEGVDYARNIGIVTMSFPPNGGDELLACVFTEGLQLGGSTPKIYAMPWSLQVAGPYDGVGLNYGIVFGPTISGGVDGRNALFQVGVANQRWQIWRNGILQTIGTDVVTGPTAFVFLTGAIPQPGDILTALAYNNC